MAPDAKAARKDLRAALAPYTTRSNGLALALVCKDLAVYALALFCALYFESIWIRTVAALVAGTAIGGLFVIGHDANHSCFATTKFLNNLIGRIVFLPTLHNFTLWRIVHNRMHHRTPCVKGLNSWSPFSKEEYDRLPLYRRLLELFYRTPFGIWLYYLLHRWWYEKFIPPAHHAGTQRRAQWLDFATTVVYLAAFLGVLVWVAQQSATLEVWEAVVFGFVIPFVQWNFLAGYTVYAQHTHPLVKWYRTAEEAEAAEATQQDLTVHWDYPHLYGMLSNHIMDHIAHHVNTKVPLYRLPAAERHLIGLLGPGAVTEKFTLPRTLRVMRTCKLYDYDNHRWLSFAGRETSDVTAAQAMRAGHRGTPQPAAA